MLEYLVNTKINLNKKSLEKLEEFKKLLLFWNKKFNLTAICDDLGVEIKHFEDCLKNESYFFNNANVVEVGSGGGFPSIPLMCAREDLKFTLIESVGKKCIFLKEVIKELNLNAEVINSRAEEIGKDLKYREKFDIVAARAVASLDTLSEYCIPLIKKGGLFIAYKGEDKEELKKAENAISILGGQVKKSDYYSLSYGLGERSVYIIEKTKNTPPKYPRGNGKERSKPL
ncbi:MAG: 16S rRNA (guanine(527)-N(7))-methyltransferase RsmG [Clostridia bacterium]|nr:16S rRNA (guanine(527)-N(7))-methyltransferase RsmG [Clostridia bacterium]